MTKSEIFVWKFCAEFLFLAEGGGRNPPCKGLSVVRVLSQREANGQDANMIPQHVHCDYHG